LTGGVLLPRRGRIIIAIMVPSSLNKKGPDASGDTPGLISIGAC
jgi:hypothetical protein